MPSAPLNPKQRLTEAMLEELIKHVGGWIATLGAVGKPSNKRIQSSDRIAAARTGINLVIKLMGQSTDYDGEKLLQDLEIMAMEHGAYTDAEEDGPDS